MSDSENKKSQTTQDKNSHKQKALLLKDLADMARVDQRDARSLINVLIRELQLLDVDQKIRISNLGYFTKVVSKGRKGRNPKTGTAMHVPSKQRLKFKFARDLRKAAEL